MASSAADFQHATRTDVAISRGLTVAIETRDITTLFLDGTITLPLLQGLQRVLAHESVLETGRDAVGELTQDEMQTTLETLRRFACAVVVEPVLVMDPDGDPQHADVRTLTMSDLLKIWRAGRALLGLKEVEAAMADRFRRRRDPAPGAAVSDGQDVRHAAVAVVRTAGA